jgi:predicted DNA-binding transcriptional regulator AlpA
VWRWAQNKPGFPKGVQLSPGTTRWYLPDLLAFEMMLQQEGG